MNSEYKKYSLDNLKTWIQDALSSGGASPKEIYDTIVEAVNEEYYIYKHHTSECYELLALLNGNGKGHIPAYDEYIEKKENLVCDKDDKSPECQKSWTSFWEENYYPEEVKDDCMPPWGHSDMEALKYTDEELNAMCDKAASDEEKNKCREYNLREAEYYNKRAELDANSGPHQKYVGWKTVSESQFNEMFPNREKFKNEVSRNDPTRLDYKDGYIYESPDGGKTVYKRKPGESERTLIKEKKVNKWILPVQQSVIDGTDDYYVNFPDDLLKAANLKEGDEIEWVEQKDGSYLLRKIKSIMHHSV
jgi:hypothetical protein